VFCPVVQNEQQILARVRVLRLLVLLPLGLVLLILAPLEWLARTLRQRILMALVRVCFFIARRHDP
jgi:hypothetical protein